MKLRVAMADEADEDLVGIARHYQELQRLEAGRELVNRIYDEITALPNNPYRRRIGDGLPANYRRAIVGSYIIYYRINEAAGYLLAHHVRYAGRRPLSANTHRRRAAQAERDSQPLRHPRPIDN
jgi:plasmid stabilization system protein ParE